MSEFLKQLFRVGEQKASPKKVLDYSGLQHLSGRLANKYAFESMTQSEYDRLRVKDSYTVYLIIG